MCKGSDAVMLPRIRAGTDPELLAATDRNLHAFSVKGLRTLVVASKVCQSAETSNSGGTQKSGHYGFVLDSAPFCERKWCMAIRGTFLLNESSTLLPILLSGTYARHFIAL